MCESSSSPDPLERFQPRPHSNGSSDGSGFSPGSAGGQTGNIDSPKKRKAGTQYIPSYLKTSESPEMCAVCGDAATGLHYRCMTCEGCKGFFRRTVQKKLKYQCKNSQNCTIYKKTRNQCQQCRYNKCLEVGMAIDLVLNEQQRKEKRLLIQANRQRRREEKQNKNGSDEEGTTEEERAFIRQVADAYMKAFGNKDVNTFFMNDVGQRSENATRLFTEVISQNIEKTVKFSRGIPGFEDLDVQDRILLIRKGVMELMCLRLGLDHELLMLRSRYGVCQELDEVSHKFEQAAMKSAVNLASNIAKLEMNSEELGLFSALLLCHHDQPELKHPQAVEVLQDKVLSSFQHYLCDIYPKQPVKWGKVLVKMTTLRTITSQLAEVMNMKPFDIDEDDLRGRIFLEIFGSPQSGQ